MDITFVLSKTLIQDLKKIISYLFSINREFDRVSIIKAC